MNNAIKAGALFRLLQTMTTEIDRDMPITTALVFARVAMAGDNGVDQGKLQDEIKASTAGISRTVQSLSSMHWQKDKEGMGLIERQMDLQDNRRKVLRLTSKGDRFLSKCVEAMR